MSNLWSHIENEASVAGKTIADAPSAFLKEVQDDWQHHKGELLEKNLVAGAVGFGMAIAFKSAPMASLIATTALGGYEAVTHVAPMIGSAWNADSESKRNQVASTYGAELGQGGANIVETLPGFALGGTAGTLALARSETLQRLAFNGLTKPVEFPVRAAMAFNGRGSELLPAEAVGSKIDALKISELLPAQSDLEQGRFVDLKSGKVSKIFGGEKRIVTPSFEDQSGRLFVHTHAPLDGPRPGIMDVTGSSDLGIVRSGDYRSFYIGQKELPAGSSPELRALFMDDANKQAFLLNNTRSADPNYVWNYSAPQYVDYDAARSTLKALDVKGAWSQFQSLPKSEPRALNLDHIKIAQGERLG